MILLSKILGIFHIGNQEFAAFISNCIHSYTSVSSPYVGNFTMDDISSRLEIGRKCMLTH